MNQKNERNRENKRSQIGGHCRLLSTALSAAFKERGCSNTVPISERLAERLGASSTNHRGKGNSNEQPPPSQQNDLNIHKNIPKLSKNECDVHDQNEYASNSRNRSSPVEAVRTRHIRNFPEAEPKLNRKESSANQCISNPCRKASTPKGSWKPDAYSNETALMHNHKVQRSNSFRDEALRSPAVSKSYDSSKGKHSFSHKKDNFESSCGRSISSQRFQETNENSYCHKKYESQDNYGQHVLHSEHKSENSEEEFDNETIVYDSGYTSERSVQLDNCVNNLKITVSNPLHRKGSDSFNPKCELSSKICDQTSKMSVIVHTPENKMNNSNMLYNAVHSKISPSKSDESNGKVYDFDIHPVYNSPTKCSPTPIIQGFMRTETNESDLRDSVSKSNEKKEVCPTGEEELCSRILPEHYEAITNYILEIEKERKVDCLVAEKVAHDLTRFFGYYFPGTSIDYYGSYRSGLAISTSNINISLKADVTLRNSFWQEVHRGLSKERSVNTKYHLLPYEDKTSLKASKIVIIEPYTSVECEIAYLGRAEKNVCKMAGLLKTLSKLDERVKSLFIAARIWAEVCAIDEVEDGKLPAIAFPILVTYFLQRCQEPVLPVFKIEEYEAALRKLKPYPKTTASVGKLWFEFLRFYAVTFNWDEHIVSITNMKPVSKSSKSMEKVWIYIEDPFSGENVAKSVTNLDTANFIRACFDAFYNHRPSPCESSSGSIKGSKKWTYSFDSCDIYQYAPPACEDCATFETGTCWACAKKEYVPVATPLPELPEDSLLLKTADKVLQDVYNEYILSESAIRGRKAFVKDLEKYIKQRFEGAELSLFGSSVNGFGFNKSDLDINLTLSDREARKWSEQCSVLKQVMRHLRKNNHYKDVFFLPAQIPIVKFCFVRNGWCGDISFGNSLAVYNSELLHAYSTVDERCRILGCALKLMAKKTALASTTEKALSSYSYIIMVIHYLQQVKPPVLPVLQDYKLCSDPSKVPKEIVETWNTWFFREDKKTYTDILFKQSNQPRNTKTAAQLWIGLLNFYMNFNYDHVISIRQKELLPVEEKQRTFHSFNIQDPFILSKNLGSVCSSEKHKKLQVVLGNARQLFGNEKKFPKNMDNYKNYFFSPSHLTGRAQKEMECDICGDFDHETNQCQRLERKFRFKKFPTFTKYTKKF